MHKKQVEGIFGGLFMIGIGIIFLLNTTGVLPWSIWGQMIRFWPVFIIIGGLQIIAGKSALGHAVVGMITLILLGVFVAIAGYNVANPNSSFGFPFIEVGTKPLSKQDVIEADDFSDVDSRTLDLDMSAGEFILSDNKDSDNYFQVDSSYSENRGEPKLKASKSGNKLNINFDQDNEFWTSWAWTSTPLKYVMTLGQTDLTTDLDLNLSAGSLNIDLVDAKIEDLKLRMSAGSADIKFSETSLPSEIVDINVSAGTLNITVPKNVGLKVKYEVSAGSVQIDGQDMDDRSGRFETDVSADIVFELDLDVSAGSVQIVRE